MRFSPLSAMRNSRMAMSRFMRKVGRLHILLMVVFLIGVFYTVNQLQTDADHQAKLQHAAHRKLSANYHYDNQDDLVFFRKETPLIWIGGVPRSGTTLMRVMLDAHHEVRCGEETRVIPRILGMHQGMAKAEIEMARLREAKIDESVLDSALGAYILSIITKHGDPAPRLCNKDPFTLRSTQRLLRIFPNSRFILMLRDGRATAHSIITRKVSIKGFDIRTYRGALKDWNRAIMAMYNECITVGSTYCLPVYYERLVLHPEAEMRKILTFLDIPWDENVIHHEETIGKVGGASLSKKELSTDQVDKPVNTGAISKWVGSIPDDVKNDMAQIAPMLTLLGYDTEGNPPDYDKPGAMMVDPDALVQFKKDAAVQLQAQEKKKRAMDEERKGRESVKFPGDGVLKAAADQIGGAAGQGQGAGGQPQGQGEGVVPDKAGGFPVAWAPMDANLPQRPPKKKRDANYPMF